MTDAVTLHLSLLDRIGNVVSTLLLGETKERIVRIEERTLHLQKDMDEIKPKVNEMYPKVLEMFPKFMEMYPKVNVLWSQATSQHRSPLQPNEQGRYIMTKSRVNDLIDDRAKDLLKAIEDIKPTTAYDAQEAAKKVANTLKADPALVRTLKDAAYQAGTDIDSMLFVGSLHLRDLYLARHPELAPSE